MYFCCIARSGSFCYKISDSEITLKEKKMVLENFIAFPPATGTAGAARRKQKRALTFAIKRTKALKTLKRFYKEVKAVLDSNATPITKNILIEILVEATKL